jgi:hypothetical protein
MNHLSDIAQVIAALALLGNMLIALMGYRQSKANGGKLDEVHNATNGMSAKLLEVTGTSEYAKGLKQGEDNPR